MTTYENLARAYKRNGLSDTLRSYVIDGARYHAQNADNVDVETLASLLERYAAECGAPPPRW